VVLQKTQTEVKMRIKYVGEADMRQGPAKVVHAVNFILKECMKRCNFTPFGKNQDYFDFRNLITTSEPKIKIAPGYRAHIGCYGDKFLLTAEISNKLVNELDVLKEMQEIAARDPRNARAEIERRLIGQTVITK
jgi:hypothetical protein